MWSAIAHPNWRGCEGFSALLPTDQKLAGLDSTLPGVRTNLDGGVTIWFGPKAPAGHEKNWIQTM
jgi:hypothetical protein